MDVVPHSWGQLAVADDDWSHRSCSAPCVAQGTMTLSQYVLLGPNGPPHLVCCGNWFAFPKSRAVVG